MKFVDRIRNGAVLAIGAGAIVGLMVPRPSLSREPPPVSSTVKSQAAQHYSTGKTFEASGALVEACSEFATAVKLNPHFGKAYVCVGNCDVGSGLLDQAIQDYHHALSVDIDPANAGVAHHGLGYVYAEKEQLELAAKEFEIEIALSPYDPQAREALKIVHARERLRKIEHSHLDLMVGKLMARHINQVSQAPLAETLLTDEQLGSLGFLLSMLKILYWGKFVILFVVIAATAIVHFRGRSTGPLHPRPCAENGPTLTEGFKENTSGQGKRAAIPEGVKGWSWGAFLLNIFWALGNETYLGLLLLVPLVGLVMLPLLGTKGREWAWRNKRWQSLDHFNCVQHKWSQWGVGLTLGGGIIITLFLLLSFQFVTHS